MAKTATRKSHDASAINRIFHQQKRAFQGEQAPSVAARRQKLKALRKALLQHRDDFHKALRHDFSKPSTEVDLIEIHTVRQEIDHALANLKSWAAPKSVGQPSLLLGSSSEIRYEPEGVVLIIAPWNYPVTLTLGPLISAIAAGNRVILKPSEFSPDTNDVMTSIVRECFSEDEIACIRGDVETAQALLKLPFDHIFFTGSTHVGREVMKAAAENLTPVTLELGGKSPAVVDKSADVDDAAWKVALGKFANAGQTCLAPDYALVHHDVQTEFIYALKRCIREFYGTTPKERRRSADFARMVRRKHFDHVNGLLTDAVERGATVAIGGDADISDRYIAPTVLTDVPKNAALLQEEIFGPVLPVIPFHDLNQAITFITDRPKPLGLYLYGSNDDVFEEIIARTSSGAACINELPLHFYNPELPFGGVGESGFGRYHGQAGFETFSNQRSVLRRHVGSTAIRQLTPPYNGTFGQIIAEIVKRL